MDVLELLNELVEMNESDLKTKTRDELRKVLTTLVSGESTRIHKMKKADLIVEVLYRVADYRETTRKAEAFDKVVPDLTADELERFDKVAIQYDVTEGTGLGTLAKETYEQFRAICQSRYVDGKWLEYPAALSDLANQVAGRLEAMGHKSTTLLSYRSEVLTLLEKLVESDREQFYFDAFWVYLTGHGYDDIKRGRKSRGKGDDCQPCLAKSLYTIWRFTHTEVKKQVETAGIDAKELTYKGLDITKMLEWANDVLTKLDPIDGNRKLWRPVSVALAIATGRRQVEIHSTGEFRRVDDYHVEFTGQAKARGKAFLAYEENPSYVIPTLLKAELVVKGHEWLKAMSGKYYPTEKQVNDNVNRDVNSYLKEVAAKTLTTVDKDGNDISETVASNFIYHNLREVYAAASYDVEGCQKYKRNVLYRWVNEVLGEDRGGSGARSTAARYMDEYDLVEGSVNRI